MFRADMLSINIHVMIHTYTLSSIRNFDIIVLHKTAVCDNCSQKSSCTRHPISINIIHRCSYISGEFPSQRPVTRSCDIFFDLRLNKRLSIHSWGWWFETQSGSLWRHCGDFRVNADIYGLLFRPIKLGTFYSGTTIITGVAIAFGP